MSKLKVTTISDPDNNNTALTVASDGKVTLAQDTTFSGNVGIGTSSPQNPLHIYDATDNAVVRVESGDQYSYIQFKDSGTTYLPYVGGDTDALRFGTSNIERMRIDSSGNLLLGKTATNIATEGIQIRPDRLEATRDSGQPLNLNRTTSDGDVLKFFKDGTAFGSIGNSSTNLNIDATSSNRSGIALGGGIVPRYNQANSDNTVDLGNGTYRFKDLYLSGGAYIGGTGSANYLDDYEEGTHTVTVGTGGGSITLSSTRNKLTYTKVGGMVTVRGRLDVSSVSSPSGELTLSLPFGASNGNTENDSAVSLFMWSTTASELGLWAGWVPTGGSTVIIRYGNAHSPSASGANYIDSNTEIRICATYPVG